MLRSLLIKSNFYNSSLVTRNYSLYTEKSCVKKVEGKKSLWKKIANCIDSNKDKADPTCTNKPQEIPKPQPTPNLSHFEGTAYKTSGSAYIVQNERILQTTKNPQLREDKILEKIESSLHCKNLEDPMPPFETVEKRLIDLCDKKLHPYYKMHMSIPKRVREQPIDLKSFVEYKSRSGPCEAGEIPKILQFNTELLDKKNMFADCKRVEPPMQLIGKMVEIRKNLKPTLEVKKSTSKHKL